MARTQSVAARAKRIKLLVFDVDGVLTDGKLYIFPLPKNDQNGASKMSKSRRTDRGDFGPVLEVKGFHAHDGMGISILHSGGTQDGINH